MTANGHGASFWSGENILKLDSDDDGTNSVNILFFKKVNFVPANGEFYGM